MATFKQLGLSAITASILFTGCAYKSDVDKRSENTIIEDEKKKLQAYEALKFTTPPPPPLTLPPVYEEPTIMSNGKAISFSATDAPLSQLLYVLSKEAGLNLVVDNDVNVTRPVTIHMKDADLQDALDITMNISDSYVEVKGNILHVKKIMTKTFEIPYINLSPKATSNLGGDMLGETEQDTGLAGEFSMGYESDDEKSDFYKQLEDSLENILSEEGKYSINKFSGTLVVTDKRSNVQQVEKAIESLKKFLGKQVLIEAKIMEVILNDSHQLGVNWQKAWQNINAGTNTLTLGTNFNDSIANPLSQTATIAAGNTFNSEVGTPVGTLASSMAYTSTNFDAVLQAMQTAGSIEVVSNPRLKVMNGQSGILSSGNMVPYWEKEIEYTQTTTGTGATATTTVTPQITYNRIDVLNGISIGLSPIIRDNGEVLLNIIPVITNIEEDKVFSDANGEVARAPILNVKEAGTTILTKDDDMVVIGGLISSVKKNTEYKTPYAGDVPFAGNLFKRVNNSYEKRELVIILKIDVDERRY